MVAPIGECARMFGCPCARECRLNGECQERVRMAEDREALREKLAVPSEEIARIIENLSQPECIWPKGCANSERCKLAGRCLASEQREALTSPAPMGSGSFVVLPTAYNGCTCDCHRVTGVVHCVPCCTPIDEEDAMTITTNDPAVLKRQIEELQATNRELSALTQSQFTTIASLQERNDNQRADLKHIQSGLKRAKTALEEARALLASVGAIR